MFGDEIEPPETDALALEYITYVPFYSSCVVCGTSRPEEVERHGADEDHEPFPSRKGTQRMHHPHT